MNDVSAVVSPLAAAPACLRLFELQRRLYLCQLDLAHERSPCSENQFRSFIGKLLHRLLRCVGSGNLATRLSQNHRCRVREGRRCD